MYKYTYTTYVCKCAYNVYKYAYSTECLKINVYVCIHACMSTYVSVPTCEHLLCCVHIK